MVYTAYKGLSQKKKTISKKLAHKKKIVHGSKSETKRSECLETPARNTIPTPKWNAPIRRHTDKCEY